MLPLTITYILKELDHIPYFRVVSQDNLISKIKQKECGVINHDLTKLPGTHWTCHFNYRKYLFVEFYDSFGIQPGNGISTI